MVIAALVGILSISAACVCAAIVALFFTHSLTNSTNTEPKEIHHV